ncbi:MAG: NAD(P)H-dependent glycerol-3-phosphate dehydrogenase [Micrococcales bacterium]|nr:NAD(P)H-dependent glycerol-3-phosphate dehydrogenase [Micrococcales bacterium]
MRRVAVLGAGSWGTAFAAVLADAGNQVRLWARRPELAQEIATTRVNAAYLPDLRLPKEVAATSEAAQALAGADVVVLAVPAQRLREHLVEWAPFVRDAAVVVSLSKGVELGTQLRMTQVIERVTGARSERLAVISGPNLAREIAAKQPAASVVASTRVGTADLVAEVCTTPYFRLYTDTDVVGCELGGATKNVVAVAVGIAEGLGFGDNTKATIITRGLAETVRLGVALGADAHTFSGLAGVGDLIATCMSPLSRNHRVGVALGRGESLGSIVSAMNQTAEGVASCESILALAGSVGVDMPICEAVVAVVHDGQQPALIGDALMARERKPEKT